MSANSVKEVERPKLEIKVPQLAGGAAASVLAAIVGSRLGVQGTLIGAAVSSVLFGLISPFVVFSIETSRHGIRRVSNRGATVADRPEIAETPGQTGLVGATRAPGRRRVSLGLLIAGVAATAVATFAVAMGVLTAAETTTGRSVDGGYTTTVQAATSGKAAAVSTTAASQAPLPAASHSAAAASTASATPTPVASASATPGEAATSAAPATTPAAAASASAAPTAQPTAVATPAAAQKTPAAALTPAAG